MFDTGDFRDGEDDDNNSLPLSFTKHFFLAACCPVTTKKQFHPALEVKTGSSLLDSILSPEVFVPKSRLRFGHYVSLSAAALSIALQPLCKRHLLTIAASGDVKTVSSSPGRLAVARLAASSRKEGWGKMVNTHGGLRTPASTKCKRCPACPVNPRFIITSVVVRWPSSRERLFNPVVALPLVHRRVYVTAVDPGSGCLLSLIMRGSFSVQQVRNILAGSMHRDPDQRMSVRELRDFALVGQLWESEGCLAQQEQHGKPPPPLPQTTVKDLSDVEAKLTGTNGQYPAWILRCMDEGLEMFWNKVDDDDEDDGDSSSDEDDGDSSSDEDDEDSSSDDSPPSLVHSDDE